MKKKILFSSLLCGSSDKISEKSSNTSTNAYKDLVETISKSITFQWQGNSFIFQKESFNGNTFTITGDFSKDLDDLVADKEIKIGYVFENEVETKIAYSKEMTMIFSVDNLSSVASSYNKPFFHPIAEVHFYIDGENITSEKFTFENVVIKGNTVASLSFSQGNNAVSNYKVFSDDGEVTLTISNDDLASYGLESRIETKSTKIRSRSDITSFTVATPDKNAVSQNAIQVTTLQDSKATYLFGANLYIRPKNSKVDWTSYVSVINEYTRIPTADNPLDVSFPLGLIVKDGEDFFIRFKNIVENANIDELILSMFVISERTTTTLFLLKADGVLQTNPANYHTEIMTSLKVLDDTGVENTEAFIKDKYYTFKLEGLKRSGIRDTGSRVNVVISSKDLNAVRSSFTLLVP